MSKITKIIARQVYDSSGNPTIEAEVFSKNISASSICPSGASTGTYEAYEKRDTSNRKYLGKSVLKPVSYVNKIISKKLRNQNVHNQEKIDHILIKLDGTKQKSKIGAYAILAISMAVKKLSARAEKSRSKNFCMLLLLHILQLIIFIYHHNFYLINYSYLLLTNIHHILYHEVNSFQ